MNAQEPSVKTNPPWLQLDDDSCQADIKTNAEDFQVREVLGFGLSGEGEHHFLYVEKRHLNTEFLIRQLAKQLDISSKKISHSGLKDRHGVTQQWLSVHMPGVMTFDWQKAFLELNDQLQAKDEESAVVLLESGLNRKKLQVGVHKANDFDLVLREVKGDRLSWEKRLEKIQQSGFSNYFGAQRFGHEGRNIEAAFNWISADRGPKRLPQHKRSLFLSTIRSYFFNQYLYNRIQEQQKISPLVGDRVMLSGNRSQFDVTEENLEEVCSRFSEGDLSVSGPLIGAVKPDDVCATDQQFLSSQEEIVAALDKLRVDGARRPVIQKVEGFAWEWIQDDQLRLQFRLPKGAYATSLLAACGAITDRAS